MLSWKKINILLTQQYKSGQSFRICRRNQVIKCYFKSSLILKFNNINFSDSYNNLETSLKMFTGETYLQVYYMKY